jgi:hypothetical protein
MAGAGGLATSRILSKAGQGGCLPHEHDDVVRSKRCMQNMTSRACLANELLQQLLRSPRHLQLRHVAATLLHKCNSQKEALQKVRQDLAARKQGSVRNMGLAFKRTDWNGNKRLDRQEFDDAMRSVGVFLKSQQLSAVFRAFDKDDSGAVRWFYERCSS